MIDSIADLSQRLRWKLSCWVNKIPYYGKGLSKRFFTAEEQDDLDQLAVQLASALQLQTEIIDELKALSPAIRYWATREHATNIEGGIFLVNEALVIFTKACGKERVVGFFEQFVLDEGIFRASIKFFFDLPTFFRESGYVNHEGLIEEADQDAASQLFINQLTSTLVKAAPERFEWAALCDQLGVLFHEE